MTKYLRPKASGLFDKAMRLAELQAMGDPLARLDEVIAWSLFDAVFERIPKAEPKGLGGRPALAPAMMFQALVSASLYQRGDAPLEFQVTDRLSFKRGLGLTDADKSPEEKTLWAFRETLAKQALIEPLCPLFHEALEARGMFARQGQRVEATFVAVARPRNSREDNATIQAGGAPEGWKDQPPKARQKEVDARWTRKNGERYYSDKNHVKVESRSRLIEDFTVTAASVPDRQALAELIAEGAPTTSLDSASTGERCAKLCAEGKVTAKPIGRACRNKPLHGRQKSSNRARAKIRVRVEPVFATMRMSMRSAWNRCLGLGGNRAAVALTHLVYNMVRCAQIERLGLRNWRAA